MLTFGSFDPAVSVPEVPAALRSTKAQQLFLVQFVGLPTQVGRDAITGIGGKILKYMPHDAYVVRMTAQQRQAVSGLSMIRWVGAYHPAYRVEGALLGPGVFAQPEAVTYNVVVADKHSDKPALAQKIAAIGGAVVSEQTGSILMTVSLTGPQLQIAAGFDEVLWIDRDTVLGEDVDNARIQGGANYVESQGGYSGVGVNAHIYEGIDASHPGYSGTVTNVNSGGATSGHGTNTAGIVFGDGTGNPQFRGLAPDAGKFYTNYSSVSTSRWQVFSDLVNVHNVSHTTASWGSARTFFYTSISAESDDITFDHDLTWTQSQSNAGNQDSRPQAWAKNVFSVGGVYHGNNSSSSDDSWGGGASIGPASDGRIKPTMTAYYDQIGTTSSGGGYTTGFGGTSGATPIVAGHNVLAIDMFTDEVSPGFGPFGNQLRVPGGTTHQNRPSSTTLKALQSVNGSQYSFTGSSSNNRREHQGWGFPNLQTMWDLRNKTFIVDEADVLSQGQTRSWAINVASGEPALKVCLNWREPSANPAASAHLINNMSLRVTSPSGTVYWGNNGLNSGLWSVAGGSEDTVNSIEMVFVQSPAAGNWNVEVLATSIVEDNHVETGGIDADYGLVVTGGTGTSVVFATFNTFGNGCPGSVVQPVVCPELNSAGGSPTSDLRDNEYTYVIPNSGPLTVTSFDFFTRSTGGTVTVPAQIYTGAVPGASPIATTTITIGPSVGWYTATFATPVNVTGDFCIAVDSSAQTVYINSLTAGAAGAGYYRDLVNGPTAWTLSGLVLRPAWRINCSGAGSNLTPSLSSVGLPSLGSSYSVSVSDALAGTFGVLASGLSDSTWSGGSLPVALPGAPGCLLLVDPVVLDAVVVSGSGAGSVSFSVPSSSGLIGAEVFHQWGILDAANSLGVVMSNAGRASIGN
jgi:serine protease AprX